MSINKFKFRKLSDAPHCGKALCGIIDITSLRDVQTTWVYLSID